jgi:prepilin peptidase CpaA
MVSGSEPIANFIRFPVRIISQWKSKPSRPNRFGGRPKDPRMPMSNTLTASPAPATTATPKDDLGIDRAFILQMSQIPFLAVLFVAINFAAHTIWSAVSPQTHNLAPVLVISAGMILAAIIDGWAFKVPNWLTLSLVVSGWLLGILHDCGVAVDAGHGGFAYSLLGTAVGFFLLFPILFIGGMGQGDVKMQMGFGAWLGAFSAPAWTPLAATTP